MMNDSVIQRVVKAKTSKGKRFLQKRSPKIIENDKRTIFIRGANANNMVLQTMKDLCRLKKANSVFFNKKNDLKPFEDISSLEFFAKRNDASLFMFGSHNKKRPNNLVMGRTYDAQVLDMIEFGIENFKSFKDFKTKKFSVGTKPLLLFTGDAFESQPEYQRIKTLLIDLFRGPVVEHVRLNGFEHTLLFSEVNGKINVRSYRISLKKSETKTPNVELEEIGPRMDLTLRRSKLASADLFKKSCKKPLQLKPRKIKNVSRDPLGTTHGRIHMERQDYGKLQTRKMKGLKRKQSEKTKATKNKKTKKDSTHIETVVEEVQEAVVA